jgi:LuxR family transcriptional regulator, maltose regulon positive regulatory protein
MDTGKPSVEGADHARSAQSVRAKLAPPPGPSRYVARERLFDRLDAGLERRVLLLCAPAGSGKSLLLTSWLRERATDRDVAWLSLDGGDNDPSRFWGGVLAALQASSWLPTDSPVRELAPPRDRPGNAFLPALLNGLGELPGACVIVLDDLHVITAPEVLDDIAFLVRYAPSHVHLLLSTRHDPPFSLQRLRLDDQLTEVRAEDLQFLEDEARELLEQADVTVPGTLVERLTERTEGWAAGLRLAALSLQDNPAPERFIDEFAGDDRAVADYLTDEVLSRLDPHVRRFLLTTCVAERLCGSLADTLTDGVDGAETLGELRRENAFVVALDGRGTWFRYHQLFGELLRARARGQGEEQLRTLHRRAAHWFADHGHSTEAVSHAVQAADWELAADIVATQGFARLAQGEVATLQQVLDQLPEGSLQRDPELALIAAALQLSRGDLAAAAEKLAAAEGEGERSLRRPRDHALRHALISVEVARLSGDIQRALRIARAELAPTLPADDPEPADQREVVLSGLLGLGLTEWIGGDVPAGRAHLERAVRLSAAAGFDYLNLLALCHISPLYAAIGCLTEAAASAAEATALAERRGWSSLAPVASAWMAHATVMYYWGDLEAMAVSIEHAAGAAATSTEPALALGIVMLRCWLLLDRQQQAEALETLEPAEVILRAAIARLPPLLRDLWCRIAADVRLACGQQDAARAVLEAGAAAGPPTAENTVATARFQLATGDAQRALTTLQPCSDGALPTIMRWTEVEAHAVRAVALDRLEQTQGAARALERSLELAEPGGYVAPFLDWGDAMQRLLRRQVRIGTGHRALVQRILLHGGHDAAGPVLVLDPLTERELVVLRYLPTHLSTPEIAAELFVSVNTVKSHLRAIYRKLGVVRRVEAVARAQQLRLLGPTPVLR